MTVNKLCVMLDFDGVVVNSVELLYDLYIEQLQKYGAIGTREDFESLNGASLNEIAEFIVKRYAPGTDINEVLECYREGVASIYQNMQLNDGLIELLDFLKKNSIAVILVTGASKKVVENVCNRLGIQDYFADLVTGDDVSRAKPDPALYLLAKSKVCADSYIAVEDSQNGLQAIMRAGEIISIYYDPHCDNFNECKLLSNYHVDSFIKIQLIFLGLYSGVRSVVDIDEKTTIDIECSDFSARDTDSAVVASMWGQALTKNNKLFNEKIVCYVSCRFDNNELFIHATLSEYKFYFAQLNSETPLGYFLTPLAISGIIVDEFNNTLIGRRKNVTQYQSFFELLPSGSITCDENGQIVDPVQQILTEFVEETGLPSTVIKSVTPCCVIEDKKNHVVDIGFQIHIRSSLQELFSDNTVRNNDEYSTIEPIDINMLIDNCAKGLKVIVPTGYILLSTISC